MTKTKFLIIAAFMFALSVNAFAAVPVVTGDEPEPPRVVITEGDKMTVEFNFFRRPNFTFLNRNYNYKEVGFLFEPMGIIDWKEKLIKSYRKLSPTGLKNFVLNQVKQFNDFLAQSQENRDKLAEVFNPKLRQEWEEKKREKEEEKRINELIGNRKLFFASFNLAFGGEVSEGFEMFAGVGFMYFGFAPTKSFNLGFSFNFNIAYQEHNKNTYEIYLYDLNKKDAYLFVNGKILMKFGQFYSYVLGIGAEVGFKLGGSDYYPYKTSYFGLSFENGLLILSRSTDIGVYITSYGKFFTWKNYSKRIGLAFGLKISLLLNLTGK